MSFRIDDLLKPDNIEKKEKLQSGASQISQLHREFDEIGGMLHYQGKPLEKNLDEGFFKHEEHMTVKSTREIDGTHRKRRILFTREQTYELQKVFQYQQYLTVPQRDYLSRKINLTPTQVKIWFQNHRYKLKKYVKECNSKTKEKYSFFETKTSIGTSYTSERPAHLSDRSSPFSRGIRSYKGRGSPERPTMYPLSKSYIRYSSPDRALFTSSRSSKCTGCCDCERYTPPPLIKWKSSSSTSEACCSTKSEGE